MEAGQDGEGARGRPASDGAEGPGGGGGVEDVDSWLGNLADAFGNFDAEEEDGEAGKAFKKKPGAQRVERIDYASITPDEFRERFLEPNMPAILGNWSGVPAFDVQYWLQSRGDTMVPLDVSTPQERLVKLADFLAAITAAAEGHTDDGQESLRSGYLRSIHTAEWFERENNALTFPQVFGRNHLTDPAKPFPASWRRWYELFISSKACPGFPFLHKDMCSTHAFSLQVQGIKRFILFAPSDGPFLYPEGLTQCRSCIPNADVVHDCVDPAAYPLYAQASMFIADIRPGDVFFCPSNWWHTTCVVSAEPSVTLGGNFVTDQNLREFESQWQHYLNMQAMASAGAARIENVAKKPV